MKEHMDLCCKHKSVKENHTVICQPDAEGKTASRKSFKTVGKPKTSPREAVIK